MSIRLRLTLLYGGLFLAAGVLLSAVTYLLVAHSPWPAAPEAPPDPPAPVVDAPGGAGGGPVVEVDPPAVEAPPVGWLADRLDEQRDDDLRRLLLGSLAGLGLMTLVAAGLGWVVAGRVLRPLATMTATTRRITADSLDRRLAAEGPDDELKALSDTIDGLLDRLEAAFRSQRLFVANASHELRTPLTLQRAVVQVALADPDADADSLRDAGRRVLEGVDEQERIVEALLVLARSQRGIALVAGADLADLAKQAVEDRRPAAEARGLDVTAELVAAPTVGDPDLLARLVANLVDNAVAHNVEGGWVRVVTGPGRAGGARLEVANGGPELAPDDLPDLLTPFHRGAAGRARGAGGTGLGLSIAAAVVAAHRGYLALAPTPGGGLTVEVTLPPPLPPLPPP